jgi:hypothetical protein
MVGKGLGGWAIVIIFKFSVPKLSLMKKWKLVVKIGLLAVALGLAKIFIIQDVQFISISSLFITVVGGVIFLLGFILSGTISDSCCHFVAFKYLSVPYNTK